MSDTITIGVDHGYYAMKTTHFSFPTGLVEYDHEPYTQQDVLEYGGKFYVVGSGRQPLQKDKTATEDYYLLTLAAIARELGIPREGDGALTGRELSALSQEELEAKVEGYLLSGRGQPEGQELARRAQEDICRQLLEEYGYVLEKIARNSGNDIFSLGKHLELSDRKSWELLGDKWEERHPEISVELRGNVLLRDKKYLFGRD